MNSQLLDNLCSTRMLINENDQINKEYNYYHRKIINLHAFLYVLVYIGAIIYISYHRPDNLIKMLSVLKLSQQEILRLITYALPVLFTLLIFGFVSFLNSFFLKRRVNKHKNRIDEIVEKFNYNVQLMDQNSVVPMNYRYPYAVNSLINYVQNRRADNIKEALNLYEQDMMHMQQMNQLRNIEQQARATRYVVVRRY